MGFWDMLFGKSYTDEELSQNLTIQIVLKRCRQIKELAKYWPEARDCMLIIYPCDANGKINYNNPEYIKVYTGAEYERTGNGWSQNVDEEAEKWEQYSDDAKKEFWREFLFKYVCSTSGTIESKPISSDPEIPYQIIMSYLYGEMKKLFPESRLGDRPSKCKSVIINR